MEKNRVKKVAKDVSKKEKENQKQSPLKKQCF